MITSSSKEAGIWQQLLPTDFHLFTYKAILTFTSPGRLGAESAASAIRDGIGRGLKRLGFCTDLQSCQCAYCLYFKPTGISRGAISPPYLIECPGMPRSIRQSDRVVMRLRLIGRAVRELPWFIAALLHTGQIGIGEPRATFTVDNEGTNEAITYREFLGAMQLMDAPSRCVVSFDSPVRLNASGEPPAEFGCAHLVKAVTNRLQPHVGHWCGSEMRNNERDLLAADLLGFARLVETRISNIRRVHEVARKFGGKKDSLAGFTCEMLLEGDLTSIWPLLVLGGMLHIGQRTNLDRGRYTLHLVVD